MAHTIKSEKVILNGLAGVDTDGNAEAASGFKVVFGVIDITSYTTNGITVYAAEVGLDKIFGMVVTTAQDDNDLTHNIIPAANEKSVVWSIFDATSEESNATDVGEVAFVAFGEG